MPTHALDFSNLMLRAALEYAEAGFAVFPCKPRAKQPLFLKALGFTNGFLTATTDSARITAAWTKHPDANIGMAVSAEMVVVDVDGETDLTADELPLPTLTSMTSEGHSQHFYVTDGRPIAQKWRARKNVDVKAPGLGYVIAPPSVHPSGHVYEFVDEDTPMAQAPEWVYLHVPNWTTPAEPGTPSGPTESIPQGERDNTLFARARDLHDLGLPPNVVYAAIWEMNERQCEPPLPAADVKRIVKSACSYERSTTSRAGRRAAESLAHVAERLVTFNARDLLANPPARPKEIISDLVPAGLALLASAPKVGKSWLAYQMAVAVATGGEVLGRPAVKGDVLYLALEDGEFRAWSRITSILAHVRGPGDAMPLGSAELEVVFNSARGEELVDQVEEWLGEHPSAATVIIDTLQKVRPGSTGRRNQYELDVEDVGRILGITKRHPNIALLVVHHDTKASRQPGSDFVDAISGTSGIGGTADTLLVLRRKRHEAVGTLEVVGKDVREGLFFLAYDEDSPYWAVDPLGGLSEQQVEVWEWLRANGPAGPTEIGEAIGMDKSNLQKLLAKMLDRRQLVSERGVYRLPINPPTTHTTHTTTTTDTTDTTSTTDTTTVESGDA